MKIIVLSLVMLISLPVVSQIIPLDETFITGTGPGSAVQAIKELPDGKILIGGQFTTYNGIDVPRLVRLNGAGSIDPSFTAEFNGYVENMIVETDGKIVVTGFMSQPTRLNADGSLDADFTSAISGYGAHYIIKQGDKYIVSGGFNQYHQSGLLYNNLIRLNYDGSIDTSFNPTDFGMNYNYAIPLALPDGKLMIYGQFFNYNGTAVRNLVRLNADGTIDNSFDIGTGPNHRITALKQQPDGKLIVSGYFSSWNGNASRCFVRLYPDGVIDDTFYYTPGPGLEEDGLAALDMIIQPNGQILAGGWFVDAMEDIEGTPDGSIPTFMVKLNPDGSTDSTFTTAFAATQGVYDIELQNDGKILAGGWFDSYGDNEQMNLARLSYNALSIQTNLAGSVVLYPNPVSGNLYITGIDDVEGTATITDVTGKILRVSQLSGKHNKLDMSAYRSGMYIVHIQSGEKSEVVKVIKN